MVAVLKPIEIRCLVPEEYDNTAKDYCIWFVRNEHKLRARYEALGRSMPDTQSNDNLLETARGAAFLSFCRCQWDQAKGAF